MVKLLKQVYMRHQISEQQRLLKILENMQRDLNISLINEASIIFDKLKIKTYDVLKAAKTKWNFIDIEPGLVGGHCKQVSILII